jgi:CheY-like chemotaxis protein
VKIVWIDDDRLYVSPLINDLIDLGHDVRLITDIEEGYKVVLENWQSFDKIFVDIMMAARGSFEVPESEGGLRSGALFIQRLSSNAPDAIAKCTVISIVRDAGAKARMSEIGVKYIFKSRASVKNILE